MPTPNLSKLNISEKKTWKRPYKKSILGCKPCKLRKIKCDEVRPACGNCTKRFVNSSCCEYPLAPSFKKQSNETSHSSSGNPLDELVTSNPIGIPSASILELRLMHHYTSTTWGRQPFLEISSPTNASSMWKVDIPQLAFSNEIVLNALLGISSFNLLSLNPDNHELALASRTYFNRAIMKQRDAIAEVNHQNAEPLLVSAVLLGYLNWLYSYSEEARPRGVDLSTYKLCRGASVLAEKAAPWTQSYDFLSKLVLKPKLEEESEYDSEFMVKVHEDMDALLEALNDKGITGEERSIYTTAAEDVINTCHLFAGNLAEPSALEQQIITNLHRVPGAFVTLLEKEDPIAMAIMARNIALLGIFKDNSAWWIHGEGKNKVTGKALKAILAQMPSEYIWTMDFPFKVLAKEIKVV